MRISHGRPPCVIPIAGAGTGRKYHCPPARVFAKQSAIGCFSDGWTRFTPYLPSLMEDFWSRYFRPASTGGLGASSSVAFPSRQGVLLGMFSGSDIAFSMCTKGATFPPSPCIPKKLASHKLNFIFLKKFLSVIGPLYAALHFGQREERFYRDFKKSVSGQLSSQNALSFDKMYNSRQLTACCEIPSF